MLDQISIKHVCNKSNCMHKNRLIKLETKDEFVPRTMELDLCRFEAALFRQICRIRERLNTIPNS